MHRPILQSNLALALALVLVGCSPLSLRSDPATEIRCGASQDDPWIIEPFSSDAGDFSYDLAVDSAGVLHAVRVDSAMQLRYSTAKGDSWQEEVLDVQGAQSPRMAVDPRGGVHVTFATRDGDVWYVGRSSEAGSWRSIVVESHAGAYGPDPSIALSQDGTVYIAYVANRSLPGATASELRVATLIDESFVVQLVDDQASGGMAAIAVGPSGIPYVSYQSVEDSVDGLLSWAWQSEGAWMHETVSSSGRAASNEGGTSSIAVSDAETLHIVYTMEDDEGRYVLGYATNEEGQWTAGSTGLGDRGNQGPDIALDSEGRPHVAFRNSLKNQVWHATLGSDRAWVGRSIDEGTDWAPDASLAVQPNGEIDVLYAIQGGQDYVLKLARSPNGTCAADDEDVW